MAAQSSRLHDEPATDALLSESGALPHLCAAFRASLSTGQDDWLILFDTDGGEDHALTRFALCASDKVVVPLRTDLDALPRLIRMFGFLNSLTVQGLSTAAITQAFFNQVVVGDGNTPTQLAPFKPRSKDTEANMERIRDFFDAAAKQYPAILGAVASRKLSDTSDTFFTTVRNGGASFARNADDPYATKPETGVDADLDRLAERILPAV